MERLYRLLSRPFVKDLATLQTGQIVAMICSFASSILYARLLGLEGYGQYAVVLTFTGVVGLLTNLGQQQTTLTFFAEAYSRKDAVAMKRVAQYYVVFGFLSAVLLGIGIAILPFLSTLLYGSPTIGQWGRIVFLASLCDIPYLFYTNILQATRQIRTLTLTENAATVAQLLFTTILLLASYGVSGVLLGSLLSSALFMALSLVLYPRLAEAHQLPTLKEIMSPLDRRSFWKYAKDGGWIALDKTVGNLFPNIFLFVISTVASVRVMGLLRLALKLASLPTSFVLSSISRLSSSVLPGLAGKGTDILRRNVSTLIRHTIAIHVFTSIAAIVCVKIFLPIVYGPEFSPALYPFIIITLLNITQAFHTFATPILRIYSRVYYATILNVTGLLLGLLSLAISMPLLTETRALYVGLGVYCVIVSLQMVPAWRAMQKPLPLIP